MPGRKRDQDAGFDPGSLTRWVTAVVQELGGEVRPGRRGLRVTGLGDGGVQRGLPDACNVLIAPKSPEEWRHRIALAEKPAARAICAGPHLYRAQLEAQRTAAGKETSAVVRLAVGVHLPCGNPQRSRYTLYWFGRELGGAWIEGDDLLFQNPLREPPLLASHRRSIGSGMRSLGPSLRALQAEYLKRKSVEEELSRLEQLLVGEAHQLEGFYLSRDVEDITRLGNPRRGLKGDAATEAEFCLRMLALRQRFRFPLVVRLLSAGVIEARLKIRARRRGRVVSAPFLAQPVELSV